MEISIFLIFVAIVVGIYFVIHLIEVGVFKVEDSMMNATAHRKQEEQHTDRREKL